MIELKNKLVFFVCLTAENRRKLKFSLIIYDITNFVLIGLFKILLSSHDGKPSGKKNLI